MAKYWIWFKMKNLKRNILGGLFGAGSVITLFIGAGEIWGHLYTEQAIKGEVYNFSEQEHFRV